MYKKIGFISLLLFIMFFLGVNDYFAQAQELGASLSDVKGSPGKRVVVNLKLTNNTMAAQSGINLLFNPDVADIEDISIDVFPGPALKGADFFIVPGVKDTTSQDPVNSMGLFIGIFPSVYPPLVIPDGDIITIRFTINDDTEPGDFTDLIFSFVNFNFTSFADQNGSIITIDDSNFTNGLITVTVRESGGGSSCALAQGSANVSHIIGLLLILLIPLSIVVLRRLWKKAETEHDL